MERRQREATGWHQVCLGTVLMQPCLLSLCQPCTFSSITMPLGQALAHDPVLHSLKPISAMMRKVWDQPAIERLLRGADELGGWATHTGPT